MLVSLLRVGIFHLWCIEIFGFVDVFFTQISLISSFSFISNACFIIIKYFNFLNAFPENSSYVLSLSSNFNKSTDSTVGQYSHLYMLPFAITF